MRYLFIILIVVTSFTAIPLFAGQDEYDNCILTHLINAKNDLAAQIMKMACNESYKDVKILSQERKAYNECLLKYLPGVESHDAVTEIQEVCRRKHL